MKSIVIGTAGHIDHGKTALVKALTGIDADRLEEEKRRGITIDLGFAHMELSAAGGEKLRLGFVDVPGHERFVRNMLAGVGGIDLALLVIAANESIKPQTREHFEILQLLGVRRGITVLTKADLVDADMLGTVRLEVEEYLRGTFLEAPTSPIVAVSAHTGAGLNELKRALLEVAGNAPSRDANALVRLPIDRVFSMKGFGTVVTGTLIAGTIHREDELEVLPARRRVRVRGVQVHGAQADAAVAGERTALNLAGASVEDLSRGMTLAPVETFSTTRQLDVQLHLLPSAERALKNRTRVHLHAGTMETMAEIVLHEKNIHPELKPGAKAWARLKLGDTALLLPGDRFIIRQFSPVLTIGGGIVLDAAPIKNQPALVDFLNTLAGGEAEKIIQARIARRGIAGIATPALVAETGSTREQIGNVLSQLLSQGKVHRLGEIFVGAAAAATLAAELRAAVDRFHQQNPLVPGVSREQLRGQRNLAPEVFDGAIEALLRAKQLEVAGDLVRRPGYTVVMKDDEADSKQKIEDAFSTAGLKVPALPEVLAGLKLDKARAEKIITLLLRDKVLVKISTELVFHREALQDLRRRIADYKTKSATFDVAQFKELAGVSRKYAIPLLEYLDRERVTRRVGDRREIVGK
jgi:selenocysteine-specific elongation factor